MLKAIFYSIKEFFLDLCDGIEDLEGPEVAGFIVIGGLMTALVAMVFVIIGMSFYFCPIAGVFIFFCFLVPAATLSYAKWRRDNRE